MTDDTIEISTIHKAKGLERDVVIIPYCKWDTAPKASLQPVVWSKACDGDVAEIGEFPVIYGKDMQNSLFASNYYSELVMSHVDAVNLLYVAMTRASKELYMIVPTRLNTKTKSDLVNNITPLLTTAADTRFPDAEILSDVDGVYRKIHRYGTKLNVDRRELRSNAGNVVLDSYTSNTPDIKVCYPSRRFTDEGINIAQESQRLGIRLHQVFENAMTFDDLRRNISRMESSALISQSEAKDILAKVESFMSNDTISEWFSTVWDDVKCEADIVSSGEVRRPDRVMICGRRAVVVDYKFGDVVDTRYNAQVASYMRLLQKMELYDDIEGYIWYLNLGEVVKVG
jgi:ATP-dependent exoDNAse (exonuclease V) beta subunit